MQILKKFNGLMKKADNTQIRYVKTLEAKEEELLALKVKLSERETILKDIHKMSLLGETTQDAYQKEKENVEGFKTKVTEIERDIQLIEQYKTDDLKGIIQELELSKSDWSGAQQAEIQKIKMELLESKFQYLQKLTEARERYYKVTEPAYKLQNLKVKLGLQVRTYKSGSYDALNLLSYGGTYINMQVDQYAVHEALQYGRIDSKIERALKEGK
ncbi:hypothetical protein ACQCVE_00295 [Metabacillus sp. 113a]|uniref:hypothetical protein n=1 Tax=Metabacillus sp. 113a TaxID=3404706 RepID=UPI003CE7C3CC